MRHPLRRKTRQSDSERRGAALAEMAVCMPVFVLLVFAMIEFGHVYMTINVLNAAAAQSARIGITEKSTTSEVITRAQEIVGAAMDSSAVTIMVKDGSSFDDDPNIDTDAIDYAGLPDIDLESAEPRDLFIVRIEVPYDQVGILGPTWLNGVNLAGQAVMRHE